MTSKEQDVARSIYRAFDPAPLNTGQSNLYVDLDQVRGVSQGASTLVQTLARRIQLSDGKPTCQVLAGHKGSGKSTELYRLQRELQEGTPQHFVVFCKSDDDIDRNDVDFPEVLIAIVRQLATQLKEREEIDLAPGPFRKAIQGISAIANGIEIDKFQLGNGLLTLGGQIRSSPDQRREVRKALEPHTDSLLGAANDVISEAFQKLTAKGYKGIVVLVDDLDKMVVRALDTGQQTDEYLFVNRSAQLAAFRCHVVYTMPLSLAFSHHEQTIRQSFGGRVLVVPMTKIQTPPPMRRRYSAGVAKFRDIIARRLQSIAVDEKTLFKDAKTRDKLIDMTGGQPTELMNFVREAIVDHGLPLDDASLARLKANGERAFARLLRREHFPILKEIWETGTYLRDKASELVFRELVESRSVLQYVNDAEWYGLNPLIPKELLNRKTRKAR